MDKCRHENKIIISSYCHGFNEKPRGIECLDIIKCEDCGDTWRERHVGKYVQEGESEIISENGAVVRKIELKVI